MKRKRNLKFCSLILAGALVLTCALSGCGSPVSRLPQGGAEHEVLTLTPVAQDKMMITLRGTSGVQLQVLEEGIEANFPDVDIVITNNTWLQGEGDNGEQHSSQLECAGDTHRPFRRVICSKLLSFFYTGQRGEGRALLSSRPLQHLWRGLQ